MNSLFLSILIIYYFSIQTITYAKSNNGVTKLSSSSVITRNVMEDFNEFAMMPRIPKCYDDSKPYSKTTNCPPKLIKQTKEQFLLCSSFKNEEGFLSEFIAYYKLHGFDHIILYDFNSTDKYVNEIKPWLFNDFIEIRNISTYIDINTLELESGDEHPVYYETHAIKREIEKQCMSYGINNGYDYYLSINIDEYILPTNFNINTQELNSNSNSKMKIDEVNGWDYKDTDPSPPFITIADVVHEIYSADNMSTSNMNRLWISIDTISYSPSPHLLEPLDLLTIEAYQVKYLDANRINFDMSISPKLLYKLSGHGVKNTRRPDTDVADIMEKYKHMKHISNTINTGNSKANRNEIGIEKQYTSTELWLINCCHALGCDFPKDTNALCYKLSVLQKGLFDSRKSISKATKHWLRNNHYTRSLEKFQLKQGRWQEHNKASNPWNIKEFLQKSYGWHYDPVALIYSCVVRYEIYKAYKEYFNEHEVSSILATGTILPVSIKKKAKNGKLPASISSYYYERSGSDWYRNPEFIRIIEDLSRRGRGTGGAAEYIHTPYNPTMVSNIYSNKENQFVSFYDDITYSYC